CRSSGVSPSAPPLPEGPGESSGAEPSGREGGRAEPRSAALLVVATGWGLAGAAATGAAGAAGAGAAWRLRSGGRALVTDRACRWLASKGSGFAGRLGAVSARGTLACGVVRRGASCGRAELVSRVA